MIFERLLRLIRLILMMKMLSLREMIRLLIKMNITRIRIKKNKNDCNEEYGMRMTRLMRLMR